MKLLLWERQLEARNVSYFLKLSALTNVATTADFGEYTDLLRKVHTEFETRFSDISCFETDLENFTTPYSVDIDTVSQPLQMEVIDLQCDSELKDRYQNRKMLSTFTNICCRNVTQNFTNMQHGCLVCSGQSTVVSNSFP